MATEIEIPYWVKSTLPEHTYQLVIFESGDSGAEEIDLTRAEYIALKAHLAAMRGYTIGDFRERLEELKTSAPQSYDTYNLQQIARHLETARDFYRHCPDLVVYDCPELSQYIAEQAS